MKLPASTERLTVCQGEISSSRNVITSEMTDSGEMHRRIEVGEVEVKHLSAVAQIEGHGGVGIRTKES